VSAYKQHLGHELPFTTRTGPFTGTLDYIFTSPEGVQVLDVLSLPLRSEIPAAMPTKTWPSDHFSIGAVIALK
jgi:mRNA deadenylase 3'-5' endonuclease subunit Ccr4